MSSRRSGSLLIACAFLLHALPFDASAATVKAKPGQGIKWHPGHYMLVHLNAPRSQLDSIRDEPLVAGAQVRYLWADIEPEKDRYDFSKIEADLRYLQSMPVPKRLVIQVMDRRFSVGNASGIVPTYLLHGPEYGGGVVKTRTGYMARIWDPPVMDRLIALYAALAARFDAEPYFEGIATEESAPAFGKAAPPGFSNSKLAAQLMRLSSAACKSWTGTNVFLYVNWLGADLGRLIEHAYRERCGIGGPDVLPHDPTGAYGIIMGSTGGPAYVGKLPIAFAVQSPELCGAAGCNLPQELYDYAVKSLGVNYIFWLRFGKDKDTATAKYSWQAGILPLIRATGGRINSACPVNYQARCAGN